MCRSSCDGERWNASVRNTTVSISQRGADVRRQDGELHEGVTFCASLDSDSYAPIPPRAAEHVWLYSVAFLDRDPAARVYEMRKEDAVNESLMCAHCLVVYSPSIAGTCPHPGEQGRALTAAYMTRLLNIDEYR